MKFILKLSRESGSDDRITIKNFLLGLASLHGEPRLVQGHELQMSCLLNSGPLASYKWQTSSHSYFDVSRPVSQLDSQKPPYPHVYEVFVTLGGSDSLTKEQVEEKIRRKKEFSSDQIEILAYAFELSDRFASPSTMPSQSYDPGTMFSQSYNPGFFSSIDKDGDDNLELASLNKFKVPSNWTNEEIIEKADLSLAGPRFYPVNTPFIQAILKTHQKERDNGLPALEVVFRRAAAEGKIKHLVGLLRAKPIVNINAKDNVGTGYTALHWAAKRGQKDTYDALLKLGADPNITDESGKKPSDYLEVNSGFDYKKIFG